MLPHYLPGAHIVYVIYIYLTFNRKRGLSLVCQRYITDLIYSFLLSRTSHLRTSLSLSRLYFHFKRRLGAIVCSGHLPLFCDVRVNSPSKAFTGWKRPVDGSTWTRCQRDKQAAGGEIVILTYNRRKKLCCSYFRNLRRKTLSVHVVNHRISPLSPTSRWICVPPSLQRCRWAKMLSTNSSQ